MFHQKQSVHTGIEIVQLQEIPLLIQLVGMAVQERENGLQLRQRVLEDLHQGWLVRLNDGLRPRIRTSSGPRRRERVAMRCGRDGRIGVVVRLRRRGLL